MLRLFLPIQNGELAPSKAPRVADWQFDYNATLTVRAEELGFDLIFGLAQSPGSEGHGGETAYRKNSLDSMLVAAGKAALTR
jgi:FMNH2-dependent dimethyl sulfone monooxygenase